MPLIRSQPPAPARHASRRIAAPSCRGGVSSVLRVGPPTLTFMPTARTRAQRAAAASTSLLQADL